MSNTSLFTKVPANVFRDLMRPLSDKRAPKVYLQITQDNAGGITHFYCIKTGACVARVQRPKKNYSRNRKGEKIYEIDYALSREILDGAVNWNEVLEYILTLAKQSHDAHVVTDPNSPNFDACTECHYPKRVLKFLEEIRFKMGE